jgi:hypothetical protein
MLSGQRDIDAFGAGKPARRRPTVELLPKGFFPPHLVNVRRLNDLRRKQPKPSQVEPASGGGR